MRVAYITMQFPTRVETFAIGDVRLLHQKGVEVEVFSLRSPESDVDELTTKEGLKNVPVDQPTTSVVALLGRMFSKPGRSANLLRWIVQSNVKKPAHLIKSLALAPRASEVFDRIQADPPDVVHVYWGHLPSMVGYLVQLLLPEVRTTISLAAYDLRMEYGGSRSVALNAERVRTLCASNVDHIVSAFGVDPSNIEVIFDGVDLDRRPPTEPKESGKIVTIGRLKKPKNTHSVLSAFALVLAEQPHATLTLLGDGPEREALQRQAQDLRISQAVNFRGLVGHEEVLAELGSSEVFLFLSDSGSERLPNVVKEAMLARSVVVSSRTKGIEELIPSQDVGYVVDAYDIEAAANATICALKGGAESDDMRTRAESFVTNHFSRETLIDNYIEMWDDIVARRIA